jgi:hypothetical protein
MNRRLVPALAVFAAVFPVLAGRIRSYDYFEHTVIAVKMIRGEGAPPHPFFHFVLLALIGGDNTVAAPGVMATILAVALATRTWLTCGMSGYQRAGIAWLTVLCLALTFAMPLPNWWGSDIYRGQPSPNVWHNPTGIFALPFALALFLSGMKLVELPTLRQSAFTSGLMVLSLLAKPNYVLAFGPVLGIVLLSTFLRLRRDGTIATVTALSILVLTFIPSLAILVIQHFTLTQDHRIIYSPLEVWTMDRFSKSKSNIPWAILLGTAFPLAVALCYPRQANSSSRLFICWSALAVAIGTFACFAETSKYRGHGNFGWGMTLADSVLFAVSLEFLLEQQGMIRRTLCLAVLGLHVVAGVIYLSIT